MVFPEVHQVEELGFQEQFDKDALDGDEVLLVGLIGDEGADDYRACIPDGKVFGGFVAGIDENSKSIVAEAFADAFHGVTVCVDKADKLGEEIMAMGMDLLGGPAGENQ